MYISKKILVITLLSTLASAIQGENVGKYVENNAPEFEMFTQLKSRDIHSNEDFTIYKCTAGSRRTNHVSCSGSDKQHWSAPHNAELVTRCPNRGSGDQITFVELKFAATSNDIRCLVTDGGIGMDHIGLTLNVYNTVKLDYSVKFYTN